MTHATQEVTQVRLARFAGAMYLLQMAAGVFTQIYARGALIARDDATRTAQNILESERLFRIGIASDLVTKFSKRTRPGAALWFIRFNASQDQHGGRSSVGRVPDCDSGCRGFKPRRPPQ